jgi:GNAT superfamily N-acetyltransferase
MPPAAIRPMADEDARAVHELSIVTFEDLAERLGVPPHPRPAVEPALIRIRHLIETDPAGALVAEADGRLVGAALALVREGLWGLSLLVVLPGHQSAGLGRDLLAAALEHGDGAVHGGVILASADSRALRAYARAGFQPHPCFDASGLPRGVDPPVGVRDGSVEDLLLTEAVDRAVRGAPHGRDLVALLAAGSRLLVADERGYAVVREGRVRLLAALDEATAQDLLRAALATTPSGEETSVEWITSAQFWAVEPVLEAGLRLQPGGAVFLRGEVGPFTPYLPSGAYL